MFFSRDHFHVFCFSLCSRSTFSKAEGYSGVEGEERLSLFLLLHSFCLLKDSERIFLLFGSGLSLSLSLSSPVYDRYSGREIEGEKGPFSLLVKSKNSSSFFLLLLYLVSTTYLVLLPFTGCYPGKKTQTGEAFPSYLLLSALLLRSSTFNSQLSSGKDVSPYLHLSSSRLLSLPSL